MRAPSPATAACRRRTLLFLGTLVALLIAGTLKVDLLTATLWQHGVAWPEAAQRAGACSTAWCRPTKPLAPKASVLQGVALIALARVDRRRCLARPWPDRQRRETV
jgi:hypothetical protein